MNIGYRKDIVNMKAIRDMWLIQIEITNACFLECPNCTRFVGHNRKPYFMKLQMIEKAIDSLEGFPGGIGIMGGEPVLHPEFFEVCKLVQKNIPKQMKCPNCREIVDVKIKNMRGDFNK